MRLRWQQPIDIIPDEYNKGLMIVDNTKSFYYIISQYVNQCCSPLLKALEKGSRCRLKVVPGLLIPCNKGKNVSTISFFTENPTYWIALEKNGRNFKSVEKINKWPTTILRPYVMPQIDNISPVKKIWISPHYHTTIAYTDESGLFYFLLTPTWTILNNDILIEKKHPRIIISHYDDNDKYDEEYKFGSKYKLVIKRASHINSKLPSFAIIKEEEGKKELSPLPLDIIIQCMTSLTWGAQLISLIKKK